MIAETKEHSLRTIIIEEATKLFKKYGYNKIVMEDIAQAVRKGRSTIYIYYKNKEEIFDAILQKEMESFFAELQQSLPNYSSAEEKLKAYCQIKFYFIQSKTNEYLILSRELLQQPYILNKVRALNEPREKALLQEIIALGINNKEFAPLSPQQMSLLPSVYISAMHGIVDDFCFQNLTCDMDPIREAVEMLLLKTLK